jgi:hypothetical protein
MRTDGARKRFADNLDTSCQRGTTSPLRNVRTVVVGGVGEKKGRVVGMYVEGKGGCGVVGGRVGSGFMVMRVFMRLGRRR